MSGDGTSFNRGTMRGFSLLEILVVLVILGMAAALVAPPLARTVDRVRESGDRDTVLRAIEALPIRARTAGYRLDFQPGDDLAEAGRAWPPGWSVVALTGFSVERSGFCGDGELQVDGPAGLRRWRITSPQCRVEQDEDG